MNPPHRSGCDRVEDMPAKGRVMPSMPAASGPSTPHMLRCTMDPPGSPPTALPQPTMSALNPYKHAIFLHESVNRRLLVQYGIRAIFHITEHVLKEVQQ
jgi:hypothetical protein